MEYMSQEGYDELVAELQHMVNAKTVKQTDAELVTVKCKGCGGINKIQRGAVGECANSPRC